MSSLQLTIKYFRNFAPGKLNGPSNPSQIILHEEQGISLCEEGKGRPLYNWVKSPGAVSLAA